MQIFKSFFFLLLFLLTALQGTAQPAGNWTVQQIGVGEENMTPTAKWFNIAITSSFSPETRKAPYKGGMSTSLMK